MAFKSAPGDIRRVVIFCPYSGVGNLLLWIPALRAIHGKWSGVEVILVGPSEDIAAPLRESRLLSKTIPFKDVADSSLREQARFVVERVRPLSPDVALCTFLEPPRRASWWALLSGAPVRIGYGNSGESLLLTERLTPRYDIHEVLRNFKLLEPLGVQGEPPPAEYQPDEENLRWANSWIAERKIPSPRVGIHPGSAGGRRGKRKRWPLDRFISVAKILSEEGVGVVVFVGPDEREEAEVVEDALGDKVTIVRGENLGRVGALIGKLDAVVANDSGLMHLSAAVGTPVVAIFGPTDPLKNAPWSEKSVILRRPCPHAPCYLEPEAPCGDRPVCLDDITVNNVLEAVHKLLA